jgi:predicted SnoaL-like aldol condensation-catalyzing enzyme
LSESNKKLIRRWYQEVWNEGRTGIVDELLNADSVLHDGASDLRGPEAFKRFHDELRGTFPEIAITLHDVVAEGDLVFLRWSSSLRHAATGKQANITGMAAIRIENDRFMEAWQNWDMHGLLQQIQDVPVRAMFSGAP